MRPKAGSTPPVRLLTVLVALVAAMTGLAAPRAAAVPSGPPTNVACLPFPEKDIVTFNGGGDAFDDLGSPYTNVTDRNTLTWKDVDDADITGYRVERRVNAGDWQTLADDLPVETRFYADTDLDESNTYDYRVRQIFGDVVSDPSTLCRKPLFVSTSNFIVFYRIQGCPDVDDSEESSRQTCSSQATASYILNTLEGSRDALMDLGFDDPLTSPPMPVDLFPCDGGGCARSKGSSSFVSLEPSSMDPTYDPVAGTGQPSLSTPLHELFHKVEGRYDCCDNDPSGAWINEGTARSIQDKVCVQSADPCLDVDQAPDSSYFNEVQRYLVDPNQTLNEASYRAALFWTYLTEHFGSTVAEPQRGMDWLLRFFEHLRDDHKDGIDTITNVLLEDAVAGGFKTAFRDFAVANYAKDLPGAPSVYDYADEDQPPGSYGPVALTLDLPLTIATQALGVTDVAPWGVRYLRFVPAADVATIDLAFDAQLPDDLGYHVLAIRGGNIVQEADFEGPDFALSLANDAFDEVVVILTGLENGGIVNYSINGKDPEVQILDPIEGRPAQAGDPANPRKFLVKVRVLAPEDGSPIQGIDPAQEFSMSVGTSTLDLTDPEVLIAQAYVQGQYWMVVRAPVQAAEGTYDLTVDYGGFGDTEADAVNYAVVPESDNVLVIDRSGSMADFAKLDAAKDGGRLYVDTWDTGDQIGVVSFADDTPTTDLDLTGWTLVTRQDAFDAIDGLVAAGSTAIGAGLHEGLDDLAAAGDTSHPWAEVLLTDALDNTEPMIDDFQTAYDARKASGDHVPAVHTVGLGPNADLEKLELLASNTGGTFQYASEAPSGARGLGAGAPLFSELAEIHRVVAETTATEDQIYAATASGTLPGGIDTHVIRVEKGVQEATFVVNWSPFDLQGLTVTLLRPDGQLVSPTLSDATHQVFRVSKPLAGNWLVLVGTAPGVDGTYLVEASVRADVSLFGFLGLPLRQRQTGRPMPILASLSELAALPDATVTATVKDPLGTSHVVSLHDDGAHGDGDVGDGVYGNSFLSTFQPGSYVVAIDADGTAPISGPFVRHARLAFNMAKSPDRDGDGLPTWWEREHGTDPGAPDGSSDPDGDGCTNVQEYGTGTHPLDPDTDGGGQGDCSEHASERDPLDPTDDAIHQPRARAWPGNRKAWVTLSTDASLATRIIERATSAAGPFVAVAQVQGQVYRDQSLRNGRMYCYRVKVSQGSAIQSAPSTVECVRPATDPYAPHGDVVIDDDAVSTTDRRVVLGLAASDQPGTAETEDAFYRFRDPDAISSGVVLMKIWNRGAEGGATWQPFAPRLGWRLPAAHGLATVLVRFRDAVGNESETFVDTIVFEAA